jgi:hypothetical protein
MEVLVLFIGIVAGLALLDVAAIFRGVDTRDPIGDTHVR